jgi:hypothetical protein
MGSRVTPFLTPLSPPPSKAGTESVIDELKGLAAAAGPLWAELTGPVEAGTGSVVEVFQERVAELSEELPGALKGMSVMPGTEGIQYVTIPDPPGWMCIHTVEMTVEMSANNDSFRLGFQIPCSDCLS